MTLIYLLCMVPFAVGLIGAIVWSWLNKNRPGDLGGLAVSILIIFIPMIIIVSFVYGLTGLLGR